MNKSFIIALALILALIIEQSNGASSSIRRLLSSDGELDLDVNKDYILEQHNYFRNEVALGKYNNNFGDKNVLPKAAEMYIMQWDDELAKAAQDIDNPQCYDDNTNYESTGIVASNYGSWQKNDAISQATKFWMGEYIKGSFNYKEKTFLNIINQGNTAIGCAIAACKASWSDWLVWHELRCVYKMDNNKAGVNEEAKLPYTAATTAQVTGTGCNNNMDDKFIGLCKN
mmetsp:Transcript_57348/g.51635  ORF Transcript_57348/g.51635 Transcript_57348/m.51635 type:complete len:228 (+) Transcript_57348:195-878(+)